MNLLFAEQLIIDALRNHPPLAAMIVSIDAMTDFESVMQRAQALPALFVSFAGEKIGDTYEDGQTHTVQQRWGVVIAVATAKPKEVLAGGHVRSQAGEIMAEIGNALCGQRLNPEVSALQMIDSPQPAYKLGKGFFFMMFGLNLSRSFNR